MKNEAFKKLPQVNRSQTRDVWAVLDWVVENLLIEPDPHLVAANIGCSTVTPSDTAGVLVNTKALDPSAQTAQGQPIPGVAEFFRGVRARNDGPCLLFEWLMNGQLTDEALAAVITDVWSDAEFPEKTLGSALWTLIFRKCGFLADDGRPAPIEPLTLYRGSTWGRRRGMAWSADAATAAWFSQRCNLTRPGEGAVFRTIAPPVAVLAFVGFNGLGRGEQEVIVDPVLLPPIRRADVITVVSPPRERQEDR